MRVDELAGSYTGECLKVVDEMGLVSIAEVLRQIRCSPLGVDEQHIANGFEADDARHHFGGDTREIFEAPLKLAGRKRRLGSEVVHTQLSARVIQLLRRTADGM